MTTTTLTPNLRAAACAAITLQDRHIASAGHHLMHAQLVPDPELRAAHRRLAEAEALEALAAHLEWAHLTAARQAREVTA